MTKVKMNYIELNNKHQANIRGIITYDSETQFKWVDEELEYIILNKFSPVPRIRGLQNEQYEIDSLITKYNDRKIDSVAFLNSIHKIENGKSHKGSEITIISRFERRYSLHEHLILALFDYFKNDIPKALQIIENSILKYSLKDFSILQKIQIPAGCNCDFSKYVSQNLSLAEIFETFGGYDNSPLNCSNYISHSHSNH